TCSPPTSIANLMVGQNTTYTGNLVPSGQEAWLSATFSGNGNASYHPHVKLTTGATEFAFDVNTNCSGGVVSCAVEGGGAVGTLRDDWETKNTDASLPGYTQPI